MSTVVNNPGQESSSGFSGGLVVGLLLIGVLILLFMLFGPNSFNSAPATNNNTIQETAAPEQEQPTQEAPQENTQELNIPEEIDVNIDTNQESEPTPEE